MKTILSIDDEPMMLQCLSMTLERQGYKLFVTSDPEEGLNILRKEKIDLALLDVHMPVKNGFQLYAEMREFLNIPVLFVTAYPRAFTPESPTFSELWQEEFADGVTDVIYKPLNFDTFIEKVEGLIGPADETEDVDEPTE